MLNDTESSKRNLQNEVSRPQPCMASRAAVIDVLDILQSRQLGGWHKVQRPIVYRQFT